MSERWLRSRYKVFAAPLYLFTFERDARWTQLLRVRLDAVGGLLAAVANEGISTLDLDAVGESRSATTMVAVVMCCGGDGGVR